MLSIPIPDQNRSEEDRSIQVAPGCVEISSHCYQKCSEVKHAVKDVKTAQGGVKSHSYTESYWGQHEKKFSSIYWLLNMHTESQVAIYCCCFIDKIFFIHDVLFHYYSKFGFTLSRRNEHWMLSALPDRLWKIIGYSDGIRPRYSCCCCCRQFNGTFGKLVPFVP